MSDEWVWNVSKKLAKVSLNRTTELVDVATQEELEAAVSVAIAETLRNAPPGNNEKG